MNLPKSRTENIVIQNLPKEVLIYDLLTNKAFCLNETSSIVFNACDGKTSFSQFKSESGLTDDLIFLTLDELKRSDLLERNDNYSSPFDGLSRREIIRKVGLSSLVALPVISTLVAPTAANAQSVNLSFSCSNPGAITNQFCVANPSACTSGAKTLCATCGATASADGICGGNPPGGNLITCTCGGACSNPGAITNQFCSTIAVGCSAATSLCRNCSATGSTGGPCSGNPPGGNTFTCTCT